MKIFLDAFLIQCLNSLQSHASLRGYITATVQISYMHNFVAVLLYPYLTSLPLKRCILIVSSEANSALD